MFSPRVQFDSDLRHIGYESPAFQAAEARYSAENQEGRLQRYYAAAGNTLDEALLHNKALRRKADSLLADGSVAQAPDLVSLLFVTQEEQLERIRAWEAYWTPAKREETLSAIRRAARRELIIDYLTDHASAGAEELSELTGLRPSGVRRLLRELAAEGVISARGGGRNRRYSLRS